ncbi:MAG: Unknown protein [uncultured Sulfurovum sp.]|uniref:FUN14 family protein n=1 Tax=uncultured Sulfurovum sp. TaxID=269237 RepID=A0A6S6T5U9_9BACT|nr:MAG: Unknown protein [uncultured Sulfurovum sp.]
MNEQQYMEKLNQSQGSDHIGAMEKMGQSSFARDVPLEGNITADSPIPFLEMGSSFIIGLAVGFFIKKSFKMVLFILGFALIISFYMESQGIFTINDKVLEESITNGSKYFDYLVSAVKERITSFESGAGAIAGFLVGLKIG